MTTATLTSIGKPSEPWGDNRLIFIDLTFSDHEVASLATNEKGLASRLRDLTERLNKPAEYEFSENGRGGFKVKLPKPEDGPGGFGGKGGGKWQPKSPEERAEILAMNAMTAYSVMQAASPETATDVVLGAVKAAMGELLSEAKRLLSVNVGAASGDKPVQDTQPGGESAPTTPVSEDEQARTGRLVTTADGQGEGPDADDSLADGDGGVASAASPPSDPTSKERLVAEIERLRAKLGLTTGGIILRARKPRHDGGWGIDGTIASPNFLLLPDDVLVKIGTELTVMAGE